ncbi:MAG: carboxymuconolactone decarboxylase family protein, partial [Burkholderiales bacterium]|nr:carboxymuconolactone decarboxylase family protein [Burkholderiales bacterium]
TNNFVYCIHSHGDAARRQGMADEIFGELAAVVALANQGNRLAIAYQVAVDDRFKTGF